MRVGHRRGASLRVLLQNAIGHGARFAESKLRVFNRPVVIGCFKPVVKRQNGSLAITPKGHEKLGGGCHNLAGPRANGRVECLGLFRRNLNEAKGNK